MNEVATVSNSCLHEIWMWQSNSDLWSSTEPPEWSCYSDIENLIIKEAFLANQRRAVLDNYYIDFKYGVQVSNFNESSQRPVKRAALTDQNKRLRQERFMPDPIAPECPLGGQFGWVPPFILEVRKYLDIEATQQLPSRDKTIIPTIVEKAALGIVEEGKKIGKRHEAEKIAKVLTEHKDKDIKEVWRCCAHLYSMESFLYKKLNEVMRLVGSKEYERFWQSKIPTLGPFCLLLWDDPFHERLNYKHQTLYRGANLTDQQLATYIDLNNRILSHRSFQAFTSCSRNRAVAEAYSGNALFIMDIIFAFTANLEPFSQYPDEEEELIFPGVGFSVSDVEFDMETNKYLIKLTLKQRFSGKCKQSLRIYIKRGLERVSKGLRARFFSSLFTL